MEPGDSFMCKEYLFIKGLASLRSRSFPLALKMKTIQNSGTTMQYVVDSSLPWIFDTLDMPQFGSVASVEYHFPPL